MTLFYKMKGMLRKFPDVITAEFKSKLTFASKNLRRSCLSFGQVVFLVFLYHF